MRVRGWAGMCRDGVGVVGARRGSLFALGPGGGWWGWRGLGGGMVVVVGWTKSIRFDGCWH